MSTLDSLITDRITVRDLRKLLTDEGKRRWDMKGTKLSEYVPWPEEMQEQIFDLLFPEDKDE